MAFEATFDFVRRCLDRYKETRMKCSEAYLKTWRPTRLMTPERAGEDMLTYIWR